MRITTWNVNSLDVRLPQVQSWLADHRPDILVLRELKLNQGKFLAAALQMVGWCSVWNDRKTYNGVATINRSEPQDVHTGLPAMPDDPQRRVIAAAIGGVRVINVYCVSGEVPDNPKFQYKQRWSAALTGFVRDETARCEKLVLLGNFDVIPTDDNYYNTEKWRGKILCTDSERGWFKNLLGSGLTSSPHRIHPEGAFYIWLDYRGTMFQRGLGLRIDHLLVNPVLSTVLGNVQVNSDTRAQECPSDHTLVWAEFDL